MRTQYFNFEVVGLLVLTALVPWPGPTVFKISCPRESATIVRRIIHKRWSPILDKYRVELPLECPFHPAREVFWPQQVAKIQHRASQWTCALCGKSFYSEAFLDRHFDNRHRDHINMGEDAVCLSDYCDIMRCEVVGKAVLAESSGSGPALSTDIDIWRQADLGRADLARAAQLSLHPSQPLLPHIREGRGEEKEGRRGQCERSGGAAEGESNSSEGVPASLLDSAAPPKPPAHTPLHKLKANCKPHLLDKLRTRCQMMVRDCIAGLLINVSSQDFNDIEEELNSGLCWYLTCDRYWEDGHSEGRQFPWGLLFVFIMALSLFICLCYYVIWVLFDEEGSVGSTSVTASSSPAHLSHLSEESYYPTVSEDMHNEHYIYVTYPPDLKRRLIDSEGEGVVVVGLV